MSDAHRSAGSRSDYPPPAEPDAATPRPAEPSAGPRPAEPHAGPRPAEPHAGPRPAEPDAGPRPAEPDADGTGTRPAEPDAAGPRTAGREPIGLVVALVTVFVLVLCAGGALALYLMREGPAAAARSAPTAALSGAAASPSYDPGTIRKGQCVANDGTVEVPKLRVVACTPGSYLVLARLDGTSDTNRCTIIPGSTHEFYYQTAPSISDFVLCLRRQ